MKVHTVSGRTIDDILKDTIRVNVNEFGIRCIGVELGHKRLEPCIEYLIC